MDVKLISLKTILFSIFFSIFILFLTFVSSCIKDTPKVVFCNVGQGDGIYIRTSDKIDILIDAGSGNSILTCLARYMPIYDRTIEFAFLTHPDKDHSGGYIDILSRYKVEHFYITSESKTKTFKEVEKLGNKMVSRLYQGQYLTLGSATIDILWPNRNVILQSGATNQTSYVLSYRDEKISVLFTGDIDPIDIYMMIETCVKVCDRSDFQTAILKIPHHGSKNGLTSQLLELVNPTLSIISVGKNSYGLPSPEIITLLEKFHEKYLRTDQMGDIVIDYNETGWKVRK